MSMIGQRIRELRKKANLTQAELAEGVITRSYISLIENGTVQPSYDTLEKLSKRLNCRVEDFFEQPKNKSLLLADWKKTIKHAEGEIESGNVFQATKIIQNLNITDPEDLSSYDLGVLVWIKGIIEQSHTNWSKAEEYFRNSLMHLQNTSHIREYVRSLDSLSNVYLQMDQIEQAFCTLNEAYDQIIHHGIGGFIKISVLTNMGIVHGKMGEYISAIRWLNHAKKLNEDTGMHFKAGHIFMALGICNRRAGRYGEAEESYIQALKFFELVQDEENKSGIYTNLGILYTHKKDYAKSIEYLLRAFDHYDKLGIQEGKFNVKAELAISFYYNKQFHESATQCYQLIAQANDSNHRGTAYRILGLMEYDKKNYFKAIEHLLEAKAIFKQFDDNDKLRLVLEHLADTYAAIDKPEQAIQNYKQILQLEN